MKYDLIVVTAANRAQARGYKAQLRGCGRFVVIPDPGDKRVGSLGATVNALRVVLRRKSSLKNLLICHSGGDAKRTPAYAAMGKAFVPMPDSRALLHHIVDAMEELPSSGGVTVCCGDVVPRLDAARVRFSNKGVTGVAYPDGAWQARRHGVYLASDASQPFSQVKGFLQKPNVKSGRHLIDTGIMHFDWATARKMAKLPVAGDIYEEFPAMLLGGFAPYSVSVVPKCEFFHVGSSRELLDLLGRPTKEGLVLTDGVAAQIDYLGGENIVTNVPSSYGAISLEKGECLTSLPLEGGRWYHLKYNIDDTFKTDGLWDKHGMGEKMKKIDHARLLALRDDAKNVVVKVTAPARIDFAGGWSDTPPICQKEGGTVLAAAVKVDSRRPIKVTLTPRKDRFVKIVSKDLGKTKLIKSAEEIADHHDPHDWCCLAKAALSVTGFKFGSRGIDITLSSDLPKGSGMGTSSILGAALIAALLGEVDVAKVGELTLRLEQEMRTGGGWEDQFAGMTPGVKLMKSKPGARQKISIAPIALKESSAFMKELHSRSLLYFTGQKRMARNVLRRVLAFYAENPHGFGKILIRSVKDGARKAAKAIECGDINSFAKAINEYWRDKKLLDAGSTNEKVDDIIDIIRPFVSAVSLAGAGGGGFMYMLAKSKADAKKIRSFLESNPPSPHSRFYDFAIDFEGMKLEREVISRGRSEGAPKHR